MKINKPVPEYAYQHALAIVEWSSTLKDWLVIPYRDSALAWAHFLDDIERRGRHGYLLNFGMTLGEC